MLSTISAPPSPRYQLTGSFRNTTPHRTPNTGTRNDTLSALVGPTSAMSLNISRYAMPVHNNPSTTADAQTGGAIGAADAKPTANGAAMSDAAHMEPCALSKGSP